MKGFARIGIDVAGGILLGKRQDFVRVEGAAIAVLGDGVAPHGKPPHSNPVMAEGETWLRIDAIPLCRQGHTASCGHATGGAAWIGVKG